jgi:aspartyl-tRNA(Asn)/glutamyl-tRNA(Gln) amidotransferase subunit B
MPFARRDRFVEELGLPAYDAAVLTESRPLADWFEAVARGAGDAKLASNWAMGEALRAAKDAGTEIPPVDPEATAGLLRLVADGTLSGSAAKAVWARMIETGEEAPAIVAAGGFAQIRDEDRLEALVDAVLAEHPGPWAQFRAGEEKVLGFLVGRVMAASGGKADPKRVGEIFRERLA